MDWNEMTRRLQQNPQLLAQIAQSNEGQKLMQRLQQNGKALEQATQSGQQGDLKAMTRLLKDVMADREGRELLQNLAQQLQK